MRRLRPLSEAECYTRLYGDGDSTFSLVRSEPSLRPWSSPTGETLRRLFEQRLDAREADGAEAEAA